MKNYKIGTWSIIPCPTVIDIVCSSGIDFVIIDYEHGTSDYATTQLMKSAASDNDTKIFVRTSGLNEKEIVRTLETGVNGIIIPNVKTFEECQQIVDYALFSPNGRRGYNPFTKAFRYSGDSKECVNRECMIGIIIESLQGLYELSKILTIEAINLIYIGVYDLSCDMGHQGQIDTPEMKTIINNIIDQCLSTGKKVCMMYHNDSEKEKYINMGVEYLVNGVDANILLKAYQKSL